MATSRLHNLVPLNAVVSSENGGGAPNGSVSSSNLTLDDEGTTYMFSFDYLDFCSSSFLASSR